MIIQKKFIVSEEKFERELFGNFDENIKLIENALNIDVILREGNIVLMGEEKNVDLSLRLMNELHDTVLNGKSLDKQSITYSLSLLLEGSEMKIKELEDVIILTKKGKPVQPKTLGQKEYVDLIITDIMMPEMDGLTATRIIRAMDRPDADVPIIAMTANLFAEDVAACTEAGMDAHIPKPLERGRMVQIIADCIGRKKRA